MNLQSTLLNRGRSDVASRLNLESKLKPNVRRLSLIAFSPVFSKMRKSDTITYLNPIRISNGGGE